MRLNLGPNALTLDSISEPEMDIIGAALAEMMSPGLVIGLVGPLGAGKTRLARAIAEALGVDASAIASPTFVLIHEYAGLMPIYHFDVYRLQSPAAFEDLGASDYWDAGGICLIEWADRVRNLLPIESWWISMEFAESDRRRMRIEVPEAAAGVLRRLIGRVDDHGRPS